MQQSNEEVDFNLPSLVSLLGHRPMRPSPGTHNTSGDKEQTGPTTPLQGWIAVGPEGNAILQELSDDGDEVYVPSISAKAKEGYRHTLHSTQDKRDFASGLSSLPKRSGRTTFKCPPCGARILQPPKKGKQRLDM